MKNTPVQIIFHSCTITERHSLSLQNSVNTACHYRKHAVTATVLMPHNNLCSEFDTGHLLSPHVNTWWPIVVSCLLSFSNAGQAQHWLWASCWWLSSCWNTTNKKYALGSKSNTRILLSVHTAASLIKSVLLELEPIPLSEDCTFNFHCFDCLAYIYEYICIHTYIEINAFLIQICWYAFWPLSTDFICVCIYTHIYTHKWS